MRSPAMHAPGDSRHSAYAIGTYARVLHKCASGARLLVFDAWTPGGGWLISTVTQTMEGAAVEVGLTGHDGLTPLPVAFGSLMSRHLTVVQVPDSALTMRADAFMAELEDDAELKSRALRYAEYSFLAATQFTACNGLHPVEERYAR
jgi:hypothetical protein